MEYTCGELLKGKRNDYNRGRNTRVNQENIAELLSVSVSVVSGVERGYKKNVDWLKWITAYADILGLPEREIAELCEKCLENTSEDSQTYKKNVELVSRMALNDLRQAAQTQDLVDGSPENYQMFKRISGYRRQICAELSTKELAHALTCSIQHGVNIPFWRRVNVSNLQAVEAILYHLGTDTGIRTFLRAGWVLEGMKKDVQWNIVRKIDNYFENIARNGSLVPKMVLDAAVQGNTAELWKMFRQDATYRDYGRYIDRLIREISESDE
ncbi:MAG: hypothetical protein WDZ49_14745 [Litorilinea sp.]